MAISLQDHENRINDIELEIPSINDRINELEKSGGNSVSLVNSGITVYYSGRANVKPQVKKLVYTLPDNVDKYIVGIKVTARVTNPWRDLTTSSSTSTVFTTGNTTSAEGNTLYYNGGGEYQYYLSTSISVENNNVYALVSNYAEVGTTGILDGSITDGIIYYTTKS